MAALGSCPRFFEVPLRMTVDPIPPTLRVFTPTATHARSRVRRVIPASLARSCNCFEDTGPSASVSRRNSSAVSRRLRSSEVSTGVCSRVSAIWPALEVDVECCARFPWRGGKHPWLDAMVKTHTSLIGIESKRHEPFRDTNKAVKLSEAYDRPVWGDEMGSFTRMRDSLRGGSVTYKHLDATQLVKHAFGLVTESRRCGLVPWLVYLYAEPDQWSNSFADHRREVDHFASAVSGAAVRFAAVPWSDWLESWQLGQAAGVVEHCVQLRSRFRV